MKRFWGGFCNIAMVSVLVIMMTGSSFSDQVILDDLIVDGSNCIGQDCVNGEEFDFDTLILKENNLRIFFQDTSNSSSFPTNDWRITINDSANGGDSYFAVEDADAGTVPFRIKAGASADSLVIDESGHVGIGTSEPSADFHVVGNALITGNLEMGSSRSYKNNIRNLELTEAMDTLKSLNPVKYNHKSQPDEETLGFIAEDVPELVATNTRKSISPVDITAVLTRVTQEQQKTIEALLKRIEELERQVGTENKTRI